MTNIDQNFDQVRMQNQRAVQAVTNLAQKIQAAARAGDAQAQEWLLELKGVAMEVQSEQNALNNAQQATHNTVVSFLQQQNYQQPVQYNSQPYTQPGYGGYGYSRGGGFMNTLGTAAAAGAGFAIGEDIVDDLFGW
jgi:hypothetical protein